MQTRYAIVAFILILISLLLFPAATLHAQNACRVTPVGGVSVNMRTGPSTDFASGEQLRVGAMMVVDRANPRQRWLYLVAG